MSNSKIDISVYVRFEVFNLALLFCTGESEAVTVKLASFEATADDVCAVTQSEACAIAVASRRLHS